MKKLKLRCYCCGEEIEGPMVALVSLGQEGTDRVFIFDPEHVNRAEDARAEFVIRGSRVENLNS